jgi:hypothetical protein
VTDKTWLLMRTQFGRRFKNITITNAQSLLASGFVKKLFNIYVEKTQVAPLCMVPPSISGTPAVASVLTCAPGTWAGKPTPTLTYQWQNGAVAIAGATATTYTVAAGDAGAAITCKVTGTNTYGTYFAVTSVVNIPAADAPEGDGAPVTQDTPAKPANVVMPSVEGVVQIGETLTIYPGEWSGSPAPEFAYQWKLDSQPVEGATDLGFVLDADMVGQVVTCTVVASNSEGTSQRTTAATVAVTA